MRSASPARSRSLAPGNYAAQAVIRLNPDTHKLGDGEGNAFGPVVVAKLDPEAGGTVALAVDRVVPAKVLRETDRIKLVELPSPLLSAFHRRPIRHRAAVILPEGEATEKRATLYIIPGFGGDHHMAGRMIGDPRHGFGSDMIRVVLDPDCGTGHHVFADSATNGPRGRALIEELIPHIEATFPAIAEPRARLLTGHSSGGWSSLWLQVTYPETFGGVWSTSPDPVDFRDFQRINLYAAGENMFRDRQGNRRPVARIGTRAVLFYDTFSKMEDVIGDGGQLRSFEAVFSPLGPDGRPRRLWDRTTGAIDPETARAWEAYDIRLVLERNWKTLGPKLAGKLHVVTGDLDTFYLEGAVEAPGRLAEGPRQRRGRRGRPRQGPHEPARPRPRRALRPRDEGGGAGPRPARRPRRRARSLRLHHDADGESGRAWDAGTSLRIASGHPGCGWRFGYATLPRLPRGWAGTPPLWGIC